MNQRDLDIRLESESMAMTDEVFEEEETKPKHLFDLNVEALKTLKAKNLVI